MKKRMGSLFLGAMMVLLLAVPAYAARDTMYVSGSSWCSCGGKMTESVHYTGWVTQQFVDCTHGIAHSKDAYQTCLRVTTTVCPKCGNGETTEEVQERYVCYASRSVMEALEALPEVLQCPECDEGEVVKINHRQTPWITVAQTENGLSEQTCIDVTTYRCDFCGYGFNQEETQNRTVKLHG